MDKRARREPHEEPGLGKPGGNEACSDETELIARAADGEMDAFGELVRARRALVHRIAARVCGPDEAEDVSQVVFLRLWRELPRLRQRNISTEQLDRWLVRVAVNRAIDSARHVGRHLKLLERRHREWSPQPLEESLQRGEMAQVFSQVAGAIGERQRAAFVLREIEGYATAEVAKILGVAASTVRNLVRQAQLGLRRELRRRFPEYAPRE